jgi:GNAT superfamily N-acetyltransferase
MTASVIDLVPLDVPEDADAPDAADFRTMVGIRNRVHAAVYGEQATIVTPRQVLPAWKEQTDEEIHGFLVRIDGEAVGRAMLHVPLEEGSEVAEPRIEILPEHWGRGAGRTALEHLEALARDRGRTTLHGWTNHFELGGERLPAKTGWGSVPVDHHARTLQSAGYELGQVYRASTLDVSGSMDGIQVLLGEARQAADGYRVVSWTLPTPADRRDGYARMKARMSTDAPSGDMTYDEESWDGERISRMDDRMVAQGYTGLVGAVEHIASGELVAYNELYHLGERSNHTDQNDTLVLKEHRGHRLGMLVKCENLLLWREMMPESTKVMTHNAEENRPMLDINEAMGFVPTAYSGAWQKKL